MHGELAQAIALAAHGSAWLAGITGDPAPRLDADNSTFQYVRRVRFELRRFLLAATTASDVGGWLEAARERGIERFWLAIPEPDVVSMDGWRLPDRMLVGLAGMGRWFLLGTTPERPRERWRGSWALGDPDAPDQRIWDVAYRGRRFDGVVVRGWLQLDISSSAERLIVALEKAETFARGQGLDGWADGFADARRLGEAEDPEPPYHPDLLPARGYDLPARRLVAMAASSWVFGGMGSWNDLAFEPRELEDEYQGLSAELYTAVLVAFVAAVNSELEA